MWALLAQGALVTAGLSVVSVSCGFVLGALVCAASLAGSRVLRAGAAIYVSVFRGVPLLVQLLLIYHLLPRLGIDVPGLVAALVGLTLCSAAYQAEILRGGFNNIAPGLLEAARMVGMAPRQVLARVQVPLALRLTLPAVLNEAILILKASSLVSVVGVADLTRVAQTYASSTYRPIPAFSGAGAMYLALCLLLSGGFLLARRRVRTA